MLLRAERRVCRGC
uniref:Uncharacterized protein n=1 Tax=Anguilla anguilla TaxID=7936 RepID=A0A0E9QC18_ANGAN